MNIYIAFLYLSLMLIIPDIWPSEISEENEEEQADASDDQSESLHEGYRPHRVKNKNFIIKGHKRMRREYFDGNSKRMCAIMYKNENPIGILEPYQDSYRLLPVDAEDQIPVQIDPIMTKRHASSETSNFEHEEEDDYGKVDSRLDRVPQANRAKRNSNRKLIGEKHMHSLTDALSKIENNDALAEEKLKGILSDIGLIEGDDAIAKRETKTGEDNKPQGQPAQAANKTALTENEDGSRRYEDANDAENDQAEDDREKRDDLSEEMKNRIQQKLSMLKQEVQNEIERLKADQDTENEEESEDDQDSIQRRKRNIIATLVDEETSDIDPLKNNEDSLVPHIRRRRQIDNPGNNINSLPRYHFIPTTSLLTENIDANLSQIRFQSRHLQHYDDTDEKQLDKDDNEERIIEETTREKKNCKCKGEKNCVCPAETNKRAHQQQARFQDGKYSLDIDPDIYRIIDPSSDAMSARKKRESFADLVAIHGGGPVVNHLLAVKERSMFKRRNKRESRGNQLKLANMLDKDLFGPLPQNYEGELIRYKRVKRD
ncbi:uncharacterized protein LOC143200871 isoform X2 [Rhynchophorus ferrugineus]|uniref:uncharacterized protein LOC143200871 isoform X2 n=1 Tax=Rhynchophorus ferrugineus TaxID=354439 RepID=UPI003FCECDEC